MYAIRSYYASTNGFGYIIKSVFVFSTIELLALLRVMLSRFHCQTSALLASILIVCTPAANSIDEPEF